MAHRQIIQQNLTTLSELTSIEKRFLDKCSQDGILNISEKEKLEEIQSRYARSSAFYEILQLKEEEIFLKEKTPELPKTPEHTNTPEHPKRPEQPVTDGNGSDSKQSKEMSLRDAHWIATRLASDPETNEKREIVYGLLELPPGELFDLRRRAKDSGTESYTFFAGCINKFISTNVGVKFSRLNDLLEEDFPAVLHKIMSDRRAI